MSEVIECEKCDLELHCRPKSVYLSSYSKYCKVAVNVKIELPRSTPFISFGSVQLTFSHVSPISNKILPTTPGTEINAVFVKQNYGASAHINIIRK